MKSGPLFLGCCLVHEHGLIMTPTGLPTTTSTTPPTRRSPSTLAAASTSSPPRAPFGSWAPPWSTTCSTSTNLPTRPISLPASCRPRRHTSSRCLRPSCPSMPTTHCKTRPLIVPASAGTAIWRGACASWDRPTSSSMDQTTTRGLTTTRRVRPFCSS